MTTASPLDGLFISFEGIDGAGKSTHVESLAQAFRALGRTVTVTREPGGTRLAEAVRRLLLDPSGQVCALAELFLYEASRAQHTQEKSLPALRGGRWVLSERYTLATMAYQGYGRGLDLKTVKTLNHIAAGGLEPDLTVVLDVPESEFASRDRGRKLDRLEQESRLFRKRVREGYRRLARSEPHCALINGRRPLEEVQQDIVRRVEKLRV